MGIEWKDAASVPNKRLMGFAPGDYIGKCMRCKGRFINMDKGARHCLSCAIDEAHDLIDLLHGKLSSAEKENETLRATISIVSGD